MAFLGMLLLVLMLPWSEIGGGSSITVFNNKAVAAGSLLLSCCCKIGELLAGHGGEGERNPSAARFLLSSPLAGRGGEEALEERGPFLDLGEEARLSGCCCSSSSGPLMSSVLHCHGGGEDFDDSTVAHMDLLQLLPAGEVLALFGEASGLCVNYHKTSATLIRGTVRDKALVGNLLHCNISEFPIRYLGLQLALRPLTKAQWQPLLDAVIHIVPAWQRSMITRPGRLTLVKAVLAARPVHHLLVLEAPVWVLEELEKNLRGFFWVAKESANGGQCLVAWQKCCKPYDQGGLNIKNLRLQGLALRVR
ncbi:hypothetical protein QYE76_061591 [Lolium multiflorum]|uniref:Uncharacterized protein n=1 Tax=Lolium multiflorum TaxID=4521 RepID=A0AAD8W4V0_LOLMU|nr:hypothetical protein QYE76_061591 [Lolium multiflorum]